MREALSTDWKQRLRAAFTTAGHDGPDAEILEELAQHAAALYDTSRAEGLSQPDAQRRVEQQLAIWARDAHGMKRARRRPAAPTSIEPPAGTSGVASRAFAIACWTSFTVHSPRSQMTFISSNSTSVRGFSIFSFFRCPI